jgi:ribosomal protein S18 acetylase RimI-like enzyme
VPYRKAAIRSSRPEDERVLFSLVRTAFGERSGWSDQRTLQVLDRDTVFVAEIEQSAAGYVAVEDAEDVVRIEQLFVSPEHEGEGVGHQLLEWAEGYAISKGVRSLQVSVETDNERALDFYRRSGFVAVEDELLELILPQQ